MHFPSHPDHSHLIVDGSSYDPGATASFGDQLLGLAALLALGGLAAAAYGVLRPLF
jgi:hypothetical protein